MITLNKIMKVIINYLFAFFIFLTTNVLLKKFFWEDLQINLLENMLFSCISFLNPIMKPIIIGITKKVVKSKEQSN